MATTEPEWVKSSLSFSNSNCVEVAKLHDGHVGVRDSKNAEGPHLVFTAAEWLAFTAGVAAGDFTLIG